MLSADIELRRLRSVGPLTVLASIAAVLVVRIVAVSIMGPSQLLALLWAGPVVFTLVLVTAAGLVFAVVARASATSVRTYRRIAFVTLSSVVHSRPPASRLRGPRRHVAGRQCVDGDAYGGMVDHGADAHETDGSAVIVSRRAGVTPWRGHAPGSSSRSSASLCSLPARLAPARVCGLFWSGSAF